MTYPVSLIGLLKRERIFLCFFCSNTVSGRFLLNLWKSEATKEWSWYRRILIVSYLFLLMTSWILYIYLYIRQARVGDWHRWFQMCVVWGSKKMYDSNRVTRLYIFVWHIIRRYMYYMLHVQITHAYIYILYIYCLYIIYIPSCTVHMSYISILHSPLYLTYDSDSPPVFFRRYALVLSHWGMPSEGMLQCLWQQEVAEGLY